MNNDLPLVTIGVPVLNGEKTIERALKSIVSQTYSNIEIIISNNNSNDQTELICRKFFNLNKKVKVINQEKQITMTENFIFLLTQAKKKTKYFCWVAADDYISSNFIEVNLRFLETNKSFIASTSPTNYKGYRYNTNKMGDCSIIDSSLGKRISKALDMVHSNARIFSLFKYEIFDDLIFSDKHFLGSDFNIILHALKKGKFNKANLGYIVLSKSGTSHQQNLFKAYAKSKFDLIFPFNALLINALYSFKDYSIGIKIIIMYKIFNFNIYTNISRLKTKVLYLFKRSHG